MIKQTIRFSILIFFLTSGCSQPEVSFPDHKTLVKACDYLWSQLRSDGAWRSETHGIMKSGLSITPFILNALLDVPDEFYKKDNSKVNKALAFIRNQIHDDGALRGTEEFVLDYPNYATAYALRVLYKFGEESDLLLIEKMTNCLLSQQFTEQRGIDSTHTAYGAWGFGESDLEFGEAGHVDLSHTRRILQSLELVGAKYDFKEKALHFLSRVQKTNSEYYDGGFFASAYTVMTNKGAKINEQDWQSYATATCDGLLGLLAAGVSEEDARVLDAKAWLQKNDLLEYPQGIPLDDPDQWHRVMQYYHFAVRGEANQLVQFNESLDTDLQIILAQLQREDGSFLNPLGGPNKEDDPLLATTFAVIAMQGFSQASN